MAGDWIKWVKGFAKKPEVISMSTMLDKPRGVIASACMELWEWVDSVSVDGYALSVTEAFIDSHVGVTGFAESMLKVGWLSIENNGGFTIPNFDRHNSKTAKHRALSCERMAKKRYAGIVTKAQPEKRREEKRNNTPYSPPKGTTNLIEQVYSEYPRKIGHGAAVKAIARALKRLSDSGNADPVAYLIERVRAYAASPAGQRGEFTPHPATWFNQDRFNDSDAEWHRLPANGQQPTTVDANAVSREIEKLQAERRERLIR